MPRNPHDHYLIDLPNTQTLRVHALAKASSVPSVTAMWLLHLIGHKPKTAASKVTLEYIEVDIVWEALLAHEHTPITGSIVPMPGLNDRVNLNLTARCVCGAVLKSNDDGWTVRYSKGS